MENKRKAGEFAEWVDDFLSTMKGQSDGHVPCGECVGCCTSSKFIHLKPTDIESIKRIPEEIMFAAPGLPEGHLILGYDINGHCPMFSKGKCSIYEHRPETCRQYDCRVLSATEVSTSNESEAISNRVAAWEFQYSSPKSRDAKEAIELAVEFLAEHSDVFPHGYIPQSIPQISVFAIRIHSEFFGHCLASTRERSTELVDTITQKY
jgi:Fe-S-cluster containining protein